MAIVWAAVAAGLAWMCFLTAMVRALPAGTPLLSTIAPHEADPALDRAMAEFIGRRGVLPAETLGAVRNAARRAPLDARPYLILGHQALLDRQDARATAILEAGQRLDPRQRWIHLLLLDRYLRTERFADAATQLAVLSRLIGPAQAPIANALGQMSVAPETRDAVRRTLRADPALELGVLMSLARSDTDPAVILALASPSALAVTSRGDSWGPALVDRMVKGGDYDAARKLWTRLNRVPAAALSGYIYDPGFRGLPGWSPFNWTIASGGLGVAEMRSQALAIEYYGRDTGQIAGQLLVLPPGSYRFSFTLGGSPGTSDATLSWSVSCVNAGSTSLLDLALPPIGRAPRRIAASFAVPSGCPAQRLALRGDAGEFPTPINATIENVSLESGSARS